MGRQKNHRDTTEFSLTAEKQQSANTQTSTQDDKGQQLETEYDGKPIPSNNLMADPQERTSLIDTKLSPQGKELLNNTTQELVKDLENIEITEQESDQDTEPSGIIIFDFDSDKEQEPYEYIKMYTKDHKSLQEWETKGYTNKSDNEQLIQEEELSQGFEDTPSLVEMMAALGVSTYQELYEKFEE